MLITKYRRANKILKIGDKRTNEQTNGRTDQDPRLSIILVNIE